MLGDWSQTSPFVLSSGFLPWQYSPLKKRVNNDTETMDWMQKYALFLEKESSLSLNWSNFFSIGFLFLTLHVILYTIQTLLLVHNQHPWSVDLCVWAYSIAGNSALVASEECSRLTLLFPSIIWYFPTETTYFETYWQFYISKVYRFCRWAAK